MANQRILLIGGVSLTKGRVKETGPVYQRGQVLPFAYQGRSI